MGSRCHGNVFLLIFEKKCQSFYRNLNCLHLVARLDEVGVGVGVSKNFKVKVLYAMDKALSVELSFPFDRSCICLTVDKV